MKWLQLSARKMKNVLPLIFMKADRLPMASQNEKLTHLQGDGKHGERAVNLEESSAVDVNEWPRDVGDTWV